MRATPVLLLLSVVVGFSTISHSQTLTTLYSFTGGSDGMLPQCGLVQGADGCFYGATYLGGDNGDGTIFKISSSGVLTTLYSFSTTKKVRGCTAGRMIQATDGNFYGIAERGGAGCPPAMFRISSSGVFDILYSFGVIPTLGLVQGIDSNFYGTAGGGASGNGQVYTMSLGGVLSTVYSFNGGSEASPTAGLIQGTNGSFYGSTEPGGSLCGIIYRVSSTGVFTNLHSFSGGTDASSANVSLVQGADGSFYGTAMDSGWGRIFKMSPTGVYTNLYSFTGGSDGGYPIYASLIQGSDGYFYGTTSGGYACGYGTVFKISSKGALTTLYSFTGGSDGSTPPAGLVQGADGNFYGVTQTGGANDCGTVFKLSASTYLLMLHTNGNGAVTGVTNGLYAAGTNLTLTSSPSAYWHLANWTGTGLSGSDTNPALSVTLSQAKTITANFDADRASQGTPYWWLNQKLGVTSNFDMAETNSNDTDAMSNYQEYIADTDPTNSDSCLALATIGVASNGIRIDWKGGVLATQVLERCTNLSVAADWQPVCTNLPPTPTTSYFVETNAIQGQYFYRVRAGR